MNEPLISVALCAFNGEKYIKEQLDSIVRQSYKNLEIVVVDDVSTDGTFDIITACAKSDHRIKCYQNEVNLGFNKNFEKAITLTSGDYIAISDQDDVWLADKVQQLLDHIQDNWLIFSNSAYTNDKQGKLLKYLKFPVSYKGFLLRNYVTGHTTLMRREFLGFVLPFPEKGYYDWWMGFVAAYHRKLTFYDRALTYYRVHDESVIKKQLHSVGAELVEYENITLMLNDFAAYKNLKQDDKLFIVLLKDAYTLKGSNARSAPLEKIVYKFYDELFANRKPWKSLTKLIFAHKYAKGVETKN